VNLNFLNSKNDRNLAINKRLKKRKVEISNEKYFSFEFESSINTRRSTKILTFKNWQRTCEFNSNSSSSGLQIVNNSNSKLTVIASYINRKGVITSTNEYLLLKDEITELKYPAPPKVQENLSFQIHIKAQLFKHCKFSLINYRCLDKNKHTERLLGNGVEIGPGHNPKITHESVKYLEKYSIDQWKEANKVKNTKNLNFSKYIIGDANEIPEQDESLDFIFSSHVFEHLYNPIGHLEHWNNKLKKGGRATGIVPGIYGAKDYLAQPSTLTEMIKQYEQGSFQIPLEDYQYYSDIREWDISGETLKNEDRSIHVHFYERENMIELLEYATKHLNFHSYNIDYDRNHKDFYFELIK